MSCLVLGSPSYLFQAFAQTIQLAGRSKPQACFRQRRISLRLGRESLCKACRSMTLQ